jgi:putative two-component system response regulator
LESAEWQVMKSHSEIGYDILSKSDNPVIKMAAIIARHHHEKWDGSGYPTGLAGEQIPQAARIVAIADVFDALTSQRPYKQSWSIEKVMQEMRKMAGSHLDPHLFAVFEQILPEILRLKAAWER